jgi:putative flavoprotein involved in K+ transport
MSEKIETIIVGGGQAGLAAAYALGERGRECLALERAERPAMAWSRRWDSFTLVTPNWTVRLPGGVYNGSQPDGYMKRAELAAYFEDYVARNRLPVKTGVEVRAVEKENGGYQVRTSQGDYRADNVIVATGLFQKSKTPPFAAQLPPDILQVPSEHYRSPQALPPGAVLVVGSGQTGCQIADELYRAGRKVFLSTGATGRTPRRYRGRDIVYWLDQVGFFRRPVESLANPRMRFTGNPQLTGRDGGRTMNLHLFFRDGVVLLGHLRGYTEGRLQFALDLKENLTKSDQFEVNFLKPIDDLIARLGLDAPPERIPVMEDAYEAPLIEGLDLKAAGITSIVWTMSFNFDYSLVRLPVCDDFGYPITRNCATASPGLYFLGMPWLTSMKSGFLMGVGDDAELIAEQISQ